MTAKEKILKSLMKPGAKLTVAQAQSRFGIVNVRARVSELRQDGHKIMSVPKTGRDGTKTYFYTLSK